MRRREIGHLVTDLGSVTDAQARALLATHAPQLRALAGDARAVAEIAVLEAWLARANVADAIAQALYLEARRMPPLPRARIRDAPEPAIDPEITRLRERFRQELAYLPPRQGIVLEALLCGETLDEVGRKLGISRNVAHRAAQRGMAAVVGELT